MLRAVLFDLGGTLVKTADIPEILKRILSTYGIHRSLEEISQAHKEADREIRLEDYELPWDEFWSKWNLRILKRLGVRGNIKHLARDITERWWGNADVELYPDVIETLGALKGMGLKLGLVTNGFKLDLDEVLRRVNLEGAFDVTVGVDSVGRPKPCREIFIYAIGRLGVSARESLFVGDSIEHDYMGALKVGMDALLIDREGKVKRSDVKKISSLLEVVGYIKNLSKA
ncbi:hypothetical protein DRO55_04695 [Candidatus Bathyarchaeota archaeon]|nr:MAG: hypothetical protein DRO55_04695 [Candidatus Bathyarchaeota archaeon]